MRKIFLLTLLAFTYVTYSQTTTSPIGNWQCKFEGGYTMKLELKNGGSGTLDGEAITWKASGGKITITESDNVINVYSYSITGNKMSVSGGDLDGTLTFIKEANSSGLGAKAKQNEAVTNDDNKNSATSTSNSIAGSWNGATGSFTFNSGGKGIANGQSFTYSLNGNSLTMSDNTGTYTFDYSISGNTLTLSGYGTTLSFTKGGIKNSNANAANNSSGAGAELVGKWCYLTSNYNSLSSSKNSSFTNECFTLKADGTYTYNFESSRSTGAGSTAGMDSDAGTWSFDGINKITVQSQKHGTATYTIEKKNHPKNGDPMIFLNGRGYVTYFQKSPW